MSKISISTISVTRTIGALLVLIAAVLYLFNTVVAPWVMIVGALAIGIAYILKAILYKAPSVRERRLEKMGMLGGLHYFLSGSFMLKESNLWMLLFAVATVFFVYAVFVGSKVTEVGE